MAGRIIETNFTPEDSKVEETLRPQLLDDYIGQQKAKENMKVFIMCFTGQSRPCWESVRPISG